MRRKAGPEVRRAAVRAPWRPEEDALLGAVADREAARRLGRTRAAVTPAGNGSASHRSGRRAGPEPRRAPAPAQEAHREGKGVLQPREEGTRHGTGAQGEGRVNRG